MTFQYFPTTSHATETMSFWHDRGRLENRKKKSIVLWKHQEMMVEDGSDGVDILGQ